MTSEPISGRRNEMVQRFAARPGTGRGRGTVTMGLEPI